jgi:hypothetical protein
MGGGLLYPQPLLNPKILGVKDGKEGEEIGVGEGKQGWGMTNRDGDGR